jgi:hypothetical protein
MAGATGKRKAVVLGSSLIGLGMAEVILPRP